MSGLRVAPGDSAGFDQAAEAVLGEYEHELTGVEAPPALARSGLAIADSMMAWRWRFGDGDLGRWEAGDLDGYLLDFFPAQMPSDSELVADTPECMRAFLRHLDVRGDLRGAALVDLLGRLDELEPRFPAAATDRRRWGTSKALATQMETEGLDPSDPEALATWLEDFNSRPFEERDRVLGPSIEGRQERAGADLSLHPEETDALAESLVHAARGDFALSDEEIDQIEREIEEEVRYARELLVEALAGEWERPAPQPDLGRAAASIRKDLASDVYPLDWVRRGAGLRRRAKGDDASLVIRCLTATMLPQEITGLDPETESMLLALEDADWLGAVVFIVRAGPGADADPRSLVAGIEACPEVGVSPDHDPEGDELLAEVFEFIGPAWERLGVIDPEQRLTELGAWALPRALRTAWGG